MSERFSRRAILAGATASAALSSVAGLPALAQDAGRFTRQRVLDRAMDLAASPFTPPAQAPDLLNALDYDGYRRVRFRSDRAVWGPSPTQFAIELFAPGFLYTDLIDIAVVENSRARTLAPDERIFQTDDPAIAQSLAEAGQFAGFRLLYPFSEGANRQEFLVFQGASYFRAVSANQVYGASARGLALNVAQPEGEEFPVFRQFWIERPAATSTSVVVHAILDSPSVTGAYRFGIYPGWTSTVDVDASLFPRTPLAHVGIAPLTSMFTFGAFDRPDTHDYRPAVHDSQGLAALTSAGEWLWRPLTNPKTLQISAFGDVNPRGFGLIQRARRFRDYQDLEARYDRRPSVWVAPKGDWGPGHIDLVEIPTDSEVHDNIAAYWRPERVLPAGERADFSYRLTWPNRTPRRREIGRVVYGASGQHLQHRLPQVALDYDMSVDINALTIDAWVNSGEIRDVVAQENPEMGGTRVFVTFDPKGARNVELRVQPTLDGRAVGETLLHRWIAD